MKSLGIYVKLIFVFYFLFVSSFAFSQADGDYRTTGTGTLNWSDVGSWEVYSSGSWVVATEYPGQSSGTGDVTILSGAQVVLDTITYNTIKSLFVQGELAIGDDSNQCILDVQDSIKVDVGASLTAGSAGEPAHIIKLQGNLINDGNINLQQSFTVVTDVEFSGTGEIKGSISPVFNNISFISGADITADIELDINKNFYLESGAKFNDGGLTHSIEYEWYNYGGTFTATGTIDFDGGTGAISSTGRNTTFNDLTFSGGGLNVIKQAITVNGDFNVTNNTKVAPGNVTITMDGDFTVDAGSEYTQVQNTTRFNGGDTQALNLNGDVSFYSISFANGGSTAKTINGDLLVNGALTINTGATIEGDGDQVIYRGFRINGTCDFTGTVTVKGSYIDASDASVTNVSLGTAKLIIDGNVYMRHTYGSNILTLEMENNVTIKNGYLVINDDARLTDKLTTDTLSVLSGKTIYVRGADNFPTGFGEVDLASDSWVRYDANMAQTVRGGRDVVYGHLYLNNDVKTVDGTLIIEGNLYVYGTSTVGTLDLQTDTLFFSGYSIQNNNNSSINGSDATVIIGDRDGYQRIYANGTGNYTFKNLILREKNATATRTKYFYNDCNITVINDLTIENTGGNSSIQLIVDLNNIGISNGGSPANDFTLGAYCKLYTDNADFGANILDNFAGTKTFDVTSTVYYSLDGDQNIAGGVTYGNITFNNGNKTATGALDINGDITRTAGTPVFYDGGFNHAVAGNWKLNNTNYYTQVSATGTIVFDGTDQTIDGYNFNNITIASTGAVNVVRNLNVFGDLAVNDGSTLDIATLSINVGGDITVGSSGVLTQSTGTTTMNGGSGNQIVTLNSNCTLGRFYINKPVADDTVKVVSELHVNGDTYIYASAGVLDIRNQNVYFGGRLYRRENPGVSNFLTDGSTTCFNGTTAQYIYNYHEEDMVFENMVFENSGDKTIVYSNPSTGEASHNVIVNGDFTVNNCAVDGYNVELYVYGNWDNQGTFTHYRTVHFIGADQNVSSSYFHHVVFEGSGTKTLGGGITVAYNLAIDSVATLDANNNNITLGGSWDNSDSRASFVPGIGKVVFNSTSGIHIYTGTTTGSVSGKTFYDVEINKTGSTYLDGDLVVENDFTIDNGTFYTYNYDVWVGGDFDVNGTFSANGAGNVLTLNATGGTKIFNPNGATLQKVIFDASGTLYNQQSDFTIRNNDMDIKGGTLDMNGNRIKLLDNGRKLNISGGALRVDTSAVVEFTHNQSIEMSSGDLYILGKGDSVAVLENTSTTASRIFTVNITGGTIHAQNYKIQQGEIILSGSASIDATYNLSGGVYTKGYGSGAYLTLTGLSFADFTVDNMTFNAGPTYNVSRTSGTGKITFDDAAGSLAGEDHDQDDGDPGSLIAWTYPAGYYWDGGASTTNWNDAANWFGDAVPTSSDIVYLNHNHVSGAYSIDISSADAACARLVMDAGSNDITLTVGSDRKLEVKGDVTISANSTLAQADNTALIYVENNWTNLGTYTHGNSTVTFNATSGSFIIATGGTGSGKSFYNFKIDGGASGVAKYMLDDLLEVENDLTVSGGTLDLASPSNDVVVKGDWYIDQANGGAFESSSADVTFSGAEQDITNGVFYNLIINGTDSTHLNSNIAVVNALTLNSGSIFDGKDYNIYVHHNWINNGGTFHQTGFGTVVFDGTSSQYVDNGSNSTTFNNISFSNGGAKYLGRDITVEGDMMIFSTSGTVNVRTYTITGSGTDNTFTSNHYLQVEGANNFPTGFETINMADNSRVYYFADIDQYIYPTTYGTIYLRSVTDSISSPAKKIATDDLEIKGSLILDGYRGRWAVLDMATNDKNITLTGSISMSPGSSIDWGTGNSTLKHVGGNWYIDKDITEFNNLILAGTGDKYLQNDTATTPLTINGNLEIKSGVDLMMYYSGGREYFRRIQGSGSDTISMETGARILNTTPDTVAAAIPENFGAYDFNENSSYLFYSTSNQVIFTGANIAYGNVIFYNDKTVTSDGVADLDINGNWNIYEATYEDNGKDIYVAGAETYLTNYTPSSNAVKFVLDGPRDQRISDNRNNDIHLATIEFRGTQTKTFGDGNDIVTIDGDLLIDNDVTALTNCVITFNGTNWTNNGIFKETGGKIVFNGSSDQTIDPGAEDADNYFHDLEFTNSSKKVFVNNGFNINGDLTILEDTVDLGSLTHYLYDDLFNSDGGVLISENASLVLDGRYQNIITPNFEINNITCSGTGTKYMNSDWTINRDLVIDSTATLTTYNGDSDNPQYYDIYIKRNWTNNGTFVDNVDTKVIFNGSISPINITSGGSNFYNVDLLPTGNVTYRLQSVSTRIHNVLNVGSKATLLLNGKDLFLNRNNATERLHTVDGTLTVDANARLVVNNYPQDTIEVNGTLNLIGANANNVATLTSETTDNRTKTLVNINSGAKFAARYYLVEYIADQGLNMKQGSTLDDTNNLSDGTWLNIRNVQDAKYLVLESNYSGDTITNISFGYNGVPTQGRVFNVQRKLATADTIVFKDVIGALGSFRYEADNEASPSDSTGLLLWPKLTETYWTGAVDVDWHKAGNWDNGVPTAAKDAIIEDKDNDPVIFSGDAECKDLKIVDGTLRLESGYDLTVNSDLSVATGLLYVNSNQSDIIIGGDWITDTQGHYSHGGATVIFNSGEGSATVVPGYENFNNITFNNANTTFSISGPTLYLDGDFTINAGIVSPVTNNYNFYIKGDYIINNGNYITTAASNGTIHLNGEGDQTVNNGIFYNVNIDGSGNKLFEGDVAIYGKTTVNSTIEAQAGCSIDFKGDVQINSSGTFNDGGESHTFNGVNWHGDGAYSGTGTVVFNRTNGNQNLYGAKFNNLSIDCTGRRLYLYGDVSVTGDVTVKTGVSDLYLDSNTITSDGSGTFAVEGSTNVYVYGSDNFPKSFSSYDMSPTSNTRYYGYSDQTIEGVAYGNLVLNNENTKTLSGNIEVKGALTFNNSTLDVSSNNYSVTMSGGNWNNAGTGNFICRNGEVVFSSGSRQYISVGGSNTNDFYDLTINSTADYVITNNNTSNDFVVKRNLTVNSGSFHANGRTVYVGGDLVASGTGAFINSGTYYLNKASGNANIAMNGSEVHNLTINSGAIYTALDNLTIYGDFNLMAGTFDGNGKLVNLGNDGTDVVSVDGTYIVGAGGVLGLGNGTSMKVGSSGRIEVVGGAGGVAKVTNNSSGGRYNLTVEGQIAADNYLFEYMSENGIYLTSTSTIDGTYHFSNGTFSNGYSRGQLFRVENTQSFTGTNRIENVSFPNNPGGSSSNVSKYSSSSGTLEFYNCSGVFAGESFDNDPNDLINWTGPVKLTWNGSVNTDWNTVDNWSASSGEPKVPDSGTDAIIPSGLVNYPNLTTNGQAVKNLTIEDGGQMKINTPYDGGDIDLDIYGTLIINGQLQIYSSSDFVNIDGDWSQASSAVVVNNGTITFDGTSGNALINSQNTSFNNVIIDGVTQYQLAHATTIEGDLTIKSGAYLDAGNNFQLTLEGNYTNNGTFNAEHGKVLFGSAGNKNINAGTSPFYDVDIDATGVTYTLTGDMSVSRDLKIINGTVDVNANTLSIGRNISIAGALNIDADATLDMADGAALAVNNGGAIELLGTDDVHRAALTSSAQGRYSFDVNSGASIKARYYKVDYTDADGLYMASGANIDEQDNLSDGVFSNGYPGSGTYMTLLHEMPQNDTIRNLVFNAGPKYNVTRTSGSTVFFFEDASGDLGNYLYEKDDEATPSATTGLLRWPYVNLYTWEGDVSNSWSEADNWFDGKLPDAGSSVTIKDNGGVDPVITPSDGEIEIDGLTVESGTLTVMPGSKMTINGDLSTSGDTAVLIIENTVNAPTSVILNGLTSDTVTVKWIYPEGQYWYIGHSVTGVKYSDYNTPTGGNFKLYKYTGSAWSQINNANYDFDNNPVEGYAFKNMTGSDVTITHTGILHNQDYSSSINGWNLIANPYSTYLDIKNSGFDRGNTLSTVWTTTNRGSQGTQYVTYNLDSDEGALNGTQYIAPGQSFWLRNYSVGTFSVATSVRTHAPVSLTQDESQLKSAMVYVKDDVLRVTFSDEESSDEVVLGFRPYGDKDNVNNYDSEKRMGSSSIPNVYARKGGKKVVICMYPEEMTNDTVFLGYVVSDERTIKMNVTNINDFNVLDDVYLYDKKEGVEVNLRDTPYYTFTSVTGGEDDRFVIYFDHVATGFEDNLDERGNEDVIDIYGTGTKAVIKVSETTLADVNGNGVIKVYNALGSLQKEVKLTDQKTTIDLPGSHGIYIIEVRAGDKVKTAKVTRTKF